MPSQLIENERIGFLCSKPFLYRGENYSIGDEFPQEEANNIETLVRARYIIPVVDDPAQKPRHWHMHVKQRAEVEAFLRDGRVIQIIFDENISEKAVISTLGKPAEPVESDETGEETEKTQVSLAPVDAQEERDPTTVVTATTAQDTALVPEGSMARILEWVGDDPDRAEAALAAERSGKKRTTLMRDLKERVR